MQLLIFGAGGAVGTALSRLAVHRGHEVCAAEPNWPGDVARLDGVDYASTDLLNDDLRPLMRGKDAVASCVGVSLSLQAALNPPPLYSRGTRRITQAMADEGVSRLAVISATFVETLDRGPSWFRAAAAAALGAILDDMREMERMLDRTVGIDWTIMRPGWLYDAEASGDYTVRERTIPEDMIRTRIPDLAEAMLDAIEHGRWIRGRPAPARHEPPEATALSEVVREAV